MKEIRQILAFYSENRHSAKKMALATVVAIEGSSYRRIGARMLVSDDGNWIGGISGGCLEGDALRHAQKVIHSSMPRVVSYDTQDPESKDIGIGLGCRGKIDILLAPMESLEAMTHLEHLRDILEEDGDQYLFHITAASEQSLLGKTFRSLDDCAATLGLTVSSFNTGHTEQAESSHSIELGDKKTKILCEYFRKNISLCIFGHGYDIRSMTAQARQMGWQYHLVGRLAKLHKDIVLQAESAVDYEAFEPSKYGHSCEFLLMTHDYDKDLRILQQIVPNEGQYIGILGPKNRLQNLQEDCTNETINWEAIHAPIGLDIGAENPDEIAISVVAEIIAHHRNRRGTSLKYRDKPIYERYD